MKPRTLGILLGALVVLAALAALLNREPPAAVSEEGRVPGEALFPDLDVNRVAELVLRRGEERVTVRKTDQGWGVPDRFSYPADFERLASLLRRVSELKVGQIMVGGSGMLAEFGLSADAEPSAQPTRVILTGEAGEPLAELLIGDSRESGAGSGMGMMMGGFPEGQYIQAGGGEVILVEDRFDFLPTTPVSWLERDLFGVAFTNVARVEVQAGGEVTDVVRTTNATFTVSDLTDGESSDDNAARRLVQGVRDIELLDVADPALDAVEAGLSGTDEPEQVTVTSLDGVRYVLRFGESAPGTSGRYAQIEAAWTGEGDAPASLREEQKLFEAWTFVVSEATISPLLVSREDLLLAPPPVEDDDSTVNASEVPMPPVAAPTEEAPSLPVDVPATLVPPETAPPSLPVPVEREEAVLDAEPPLVSERAATPVQTPMEEEEEPAADPEEETAPVETELP